MRQAGLASAALLLLAVAACSAGMETSNTVMEMNTTEMDDNMSAVGDTPPVVPRVLIFCQEVKRRLTQDDCDDLTDTAAQAKKGTAAFNVPDMVRGRASVIELAISLDPPVDGMSVDSGNVDGMEPANVSAVAPTPAPTSPATTPTPMPSPTPLHSSNKGIAGDKPGDVVEPLPGRTEKYDPVVGRDMRAELIGEGFEIKPLDDASQVLNAGSTTTWQWEVTPTRGASYALTIKTSVEGVMANGERVVLGSTTRTRPVKVKVLWYETLWDTLSAAPAWIKLVTGIFVALAALATAWWGFVRAAKGSEKTSAADHITEPKSEKPPTSQPESTNGNAPGDKPEG